MEPGLRFGSYELVAPIGEGGMGEVWRARHRMLKRQAAVKIIRADALGPNVSGLAAAGILKRFEREAQATSGLRSPHTVALYDFGISEEGAFYYAMELLDGLSLQELVEEHGPQSPGRTVFILKQVCESLAEAHHVGLIHRDIKPANIFLCRLGLQHDYAKVLDFGLVKQDPKTGTEESALTTQGITPGSPAFMAPEMARGGGLDARVDLYSLGCVAYYLLTGEFVFDGNSALDVVMAHVQDTPVSPSKRTQVELPASLEVAVMDCLQKEPASRPQSAKHLLRRLEACDPHTWDRTQAEDWWEEHQPTGRYADEGDPADGEPAPTDLPPPAPQQPAAPIGPGAAAGGIDTAVAMAPLESTNTIGVRRDQVRSMLQHHFTRSRIDLDELERRLEVVRAARDDVALHRAVADLEPVQAVEPTPIPQVVHPNHAALMRRPVSQNIISVLSGCTRKGVWRPARLTKAVSVLGGSGLDFTNVIFEHPETEVRCVCVLGGVEITVPDDIYVEVDGFGILGGFEHSGGTFGMPGPGVPILRITGVAVLGGVEVTVKKRGEKSMKEMVGMMIKEHVPQLMGHVAKKLDKGDS